MNLINGKLIKEGNNISFIPEGLNQSDKILLQNYKFEKSLEANNMEVIFGIRPEHIHYKKTNESDFEVKLQSELSEYIGHEQITTFNYSNQELLGKFPSTINIEMNKEMNLFFDLSQVSLFDKKTKNRI